MSALRMLAQVTVTPDGAGLPGTTQLQTIVNAIAFWGLLACAGIILAGAGAWGVSARASNPMGATSGKTMVAGGAIGAFLIGATAAIVNFFATAGGGV